MTNKWPLQHLDMTTIVPDQTPCDSKGGIWPTYQEAKIIETTEGYVVLTIQCFRKCVVWVLTSLFWLTSTGNPFNE